MRVDHCFRTISVLILSITVSGCAASMASRGLLPDIQARQPPAVNLGPEIILLEAERDPSVYLSNIKSLITEDGVAHLFAADRKNQIHHVEVSDNEIVLREILGVVEGSPSRQTLDAIEHPIGTLRVLAGDKQFIRSTSGKKWQEIKGNLCEKFVTTNDNLFCAFIANGKKFGTPERKDWYVGNFYIIPFVFWRNVNPDKLVLAQESPDGWIIRAVLDPETKLSARSGFVIWTDRDSSFYFLYSVSGNITIGPFMGTPAQYRNISTAELRYARVPYERLVAGSRHNVSQAGEAEENPIPWEIVQGLPVDPVPYGGSLSGGDVVPHFFWKSAPREFEGLVWYSSMSDEYGGISDSAWYDVKIREGKWAPRVEDIVAVRDMPEGALWHVIAPPVIANDSEGNIHLLMLKHKRFSLSGEICYFIKKGTIWSAPLKIDSKADYVGIGSLSVDATGKAFAVLDTYPDKFNRLIGMWIKPRK